MITVLRIPIFFMIVFLIGCASIRESGQALGTAGQTATQTLVDQTEASRKTLNALPEWWGVHDALVCANIKSGTENRTTCLNNIKNSIHQPQPVRPLDNAQKTLLEIMSKRIVAEQALRDAYQSFVNLAVYDAGTETKQAIEGALGAVNELTAAAATIAPQGVALHAISSTFTTVASGLGNFIASERQEQLILAANDDLLKATNAMTQALTVERDKAASISLFTTLGAEGDALYSTFVQSGLVSPRDALMPLLMQIAPNAQMAQIPPSANDDVIRTAATISLAEQSRRKQNAIAASYDASLAALKALSAEHEKLKNGHEINLDSIVSQAKRIQTLLEDIKKNK
jgi:hypothetical protein